jgi:hypothetical protein
VIMLLEFLLSVVFLLLLLFFCFPLAAARLSRIGRTLFKLAWTKKLKRRFAKKSWVMIMASSKSLGKITSVHFGLGGYQNAEFGFSFSFDSSEGWSVCDFMGSWANGPDKFAKWTKADRDKILCDYFLEIKDIMEKAKVDDFYKLKGKPVELTMKDQRIESWRILTEVL